MLIWRDGSSNYRKERVVFLKIPKYKLEREIYTCIKYSSPEWNEWSE